MSLVIKAEKRPLHIWKKNNENKNKIYYWIFAFLGSYMRFFCLSLKLYQGFYKKRKMALKYRTEYQSVMS